jgi:hypothetical protein
MFDISEEKYEELRLILEKQNGRTYTLEEAKEIGDGLIDFYALLEQFDNQKEPKDVGEVVDKSIVRNRDERDKEK